MKPHFNLAVLTAAALVSSAAHAGWTEYPGFFSPGSNGIAVLDLDADGTQEAVVTGSALSGYSPNGTQFLAVVDHAEASGHRIVHARVLPTGERFVGTILAQPGAGAPRIVATTRVSEGQNFLTTFTGAALERGASIPVGSFWLQAIADVDADGTLEAIGVTGSDWTAGNAQVRDLATGAVEWTDTLRTTYRVAVGQFDGDAPLELVYANQSHVNTAGYIVDPVNNTADWMWPAGFRGIPVVGNFDTNPGTTEFALIESWGPARVFATSPFFSPLTEYATGEIQAAAVRDVNSDGIDELVLGEGQWGDVVAYTPTTWARAFTYVNPEHGVSAVALGNLDADAALEVIYGSGLTSSGTDLLTVFDAGTRVTQFAQTDVGGPHSSVALADFDQNGSLELAYATFNADSGYDGSRLVILDAETGVELRHFDNAVDPWGLNLGAQLEVANLDADPALEIVVGGGYTYDGRLKVLDGVTLAQQWSVKVDGPVVQAIHLEQLTGDTAPDVLAAINSSVRAYDGATGALLWSTPSVAGANRLTLTSGNVDADPAPEVLLGNATSFYVIDTATRLTERSYTASAEAIGLAIEGAGDSCRLVHFEANQIVRRRCDSAAIDSVRPLAVPNVQLAKPLTDSHGLLLLSDGDSLHLQKGNEILESSAANLGPRLAWRNKAATLLTETSLSAFVGSELAVRRIEFVSATPDTTPDAFTFPSLSDVDRDALQLSIPVEITGISAPAPISVTGGEYSINGAAPTAAPGTVLAGDLVNVGHTSASGFSSSTVTVLTVGGVSASFTSTTLAQDTTPDVFAFAPVSNAWINAIVTSNMITVTGINDAAPISVQGGEYSINGGVLTSAPGTVQAGDLVGVVHRTSTAFSTATTTTLTIGGVSAEFVSTTEARDVTPNAFGFTTQSGVATGVLQTSNATTIAGINDASVITVAGGDYSINGGAFTTAAGTVRSGDQVRVQHTSASSSSTSVQTTLTIGGVSGTFISQTGTVDTTPEGFGFHDVDGARRGKQVTSSTVTVTGFNAPVSVTISGAGATYAINNSAYTTAPGTIRPGDRVTLRLIASPAAYTTVTTTLTVGGVSDSWNVKTGHK